MNFKCFGPLNLRTCEMFFWGVKEYQVQTFFMFIFSMACWRILAKLEGWKIWKWHTIPSGFVKLNFQTEVMSSISLGFKNFYKMVVFLTPKNRGLGKCTLAAVAGLSSFHPFCLWGKC